MPSSMEFSEIQRLLNEGIGAIRRGDVERGRALLLQVVEADERIEPAWLWLSAAMEDPADKLAALENVLALNPNNAQARTQMAALRQELGIAEIEEPPEKVSSDTVGAAALPAPANLPGIADAAPAGILRAPPEAARPEQPAPPRAPRSAPLPTLAPAAYKADDDDPYQCAYCGRPTDKADERCPHCGRGLLAAGAYKAGGYQYLLLILTGLNLQAAFTQAIVMYLSVNFPDSLRVLPVADIVTDNLFAAAVVRVGVWTAVALMLLSDVRAAYLTALGAALLDLAWAGLGYFLGQVGQILAGVNAAFGAGILLLAGAAVVSLTQARVRLRVVLDKDVHGAWMFYQRGQGYQREGKWALAALHWRRAIALQPRAPEFYKDLGRAQTRLRRFPQALAAYRSGGELAPNDPEFMQLIESVQAKATTS